LNELKDDSYFSTILNWINKNPGKTTGAIIGFFIGILILTFGIIKSLLIILFIVVGILIGNTIDEDNIIVDKIKNFFNRKKTQPPK